MRKLNVIPIVHTPEDLGSVATAVRSIKSQSLSVEQQRKNASTINEYWRGIRDGVMNWQVDFSTLLLFQDSLPVVPESQAGVEKLIVEDLARRGSQNHQILQWLIGKGARLAGTESASLLVEEYQLTQKSLADLELGVSEQLSETKLRLAQLLQERDQFIGKRIGDLLDSNSLGVLFIGFSHRVVGTLDGDIEVLYPFGRPIVQ